MFRHIFGYSIIGESLRSSEVHDLGWRPFKFLAVRIADIYVTKGKNLVADVSDRKGRLTYTRRSGENGR